MTSKNTAPTHREPVSFIPPETLFRFHFPSEGSFVELEDKRLLHVVAGVHQHSISPDGGQTWEEHGPLCDIDGQENKGFAPSLLRLGSGGIGLIYSDFTDGAWWARLVFRRSDDEGKTWSEPIPISEPHVAVPVLHDAAIVTTSGRIVLPVYCAAGRGDFVPHKDAVGTSVALRDDDWELVGSHAYEPSPELSWVYYSDDEGKTWHRNANGQMLVTLDYSGQGHWTCSEPVAVEYAPNHLLMLYRTELGCLFQSWSSDDGTNWTQPRPTRLSADQSPAALKRIPGTNDLLVVWNQSSGDEIVRGIQRHRLSAAISQDGGATWKFHRNLVCIDEDDPAYVEPSPVRYYRPRRWSPRLPRNMNLTVYPTVVFWHDRLLLTYAETNRRIFKGPGDYDYHRRGPWLMAIPVSFFYKDLGTRPKRIPQEQRENVRRALASEPDRIVFVPREQRGPEACNQHFLVVATRRGTFLAVWTQGTREAHDDQHVLVSRSTDRGHSWSAPSMVAPDPQSPQRCLASYGFPVVVPHSGRIYLFWNQNIGAADTRQDLTALLAYRWSDDDGVTWSQDVQTRTIPKAEISDPDPNAVENWVVYQAPIITRRGEVMVGFSRFAPGKARHCLSEHGCEVSFLLFDNILSEPDPTKLTIRTLPDEGQGLRVPWPDKPQVSCAQEPTVHDLNDGRMICVMRTMTGYVYFALSADGGRTWDTPRPLRFAPRGPKIPQPVAPCPLYKLRDGRFVLIFHNNDGTANGGSGPLDAARNRRPAYLSVGREIAHPDHPLIFTEPRFLADNGGIVDGLDATEICTYTSLFEFENDVYFWYPDRKHYLLGKVLSNSLLDDSGLPL